MICSVNLESNNQMLLALILVRLPLFEVRLGLRLTVPTAH